LPDDILEAANDLVLEMSAPPRSKPTVETAHRREVPSSTYPHFADKDRYWTPPMRVVSQSSITRCSGQGETPRETSPTRRIRADASSASKQ
jgi:hypothetical protein